MTLLTLILMISAIALSSYNYLKVLYEAKRKIKIVTVETVKAANGEKSLQNTVNEYAQAPGPRYILPILGNLAEMGKHEAPAVAFTELAKKYGDIYSMTLGTTRCLVVNNLDLIREVLNLNGKYFGARPDFIRFHALFGGDRGNSLALCDWSPLQQKRRNLARKHCSPRDTSSYYAKMSDVGCNEMNFFMNKIGDCVKPGQDFHLKSIINQTCFNMFSQYMCTTRFDYDDTAFQGIVRHFDEIFWEINQGYAVDFLPWLAPFYKGHLNRLASWSTNIRSFILSHIIEQRERSLNLEEPERDFTDALLKSLARDPEVDRNTIIFMLEDFLGGHSAIGNLVMLILGHIVLYPEIGERVQKEVDSITENGSRTVTLFDIDNMPYTVSTIYEVLRYSSSPIVPHVATDDVAIAGYGISKGTIVFVNNYELNTSPRYWTQPEQFKPERFLECVPIQKTSTTAAPVEPVVTFMRSNFESDSASDSGVECDETDVTKPTSKANSTDHIKVHNNKTSNRNTSSALPGEHKDNFKLRIRKNIPHFLPFSIGKRTCIGQNLVRGFSFIMVANILQKYNVSISDKSLIKMYTGCVAVPTETYPLALTPRTHSI
ncbi:cytochrome P450 307a1-like [Sitodiplosis mosellana]|uniref:cytochrome P450 307a1-like n=1 Tax=Sitodiplosis mosellana TaxID=263140 RepID=UPI0024443395|nr:cytochrome P450 307a1-like [Sitodiplosis mosellana]